MPQPVVETRGLTKLYGALTALEGLTLAVERGEVFGFLGPNGAGKTTTIRILLDLIRPTRGEARLFGLPPGDPSARARAGYLPDEIALDGRLTGGQTFDYFDALRPKGTPRADPKRRRDICDRLGLGGADVDRLVRDDSRGTKQKIGLVCALQHDPDLLVLDEPTTGLDPLVREAAFELLLEAGRAGRTVFHSSHVLSEVERTCTRVGVLRGGRLVALERIDGMKKAATRRMVVTFGAPVPRSELELPGVLVAEHDGLRAVLKITGEMDPLLRSLARHTVRDLVFPEPDLEEAFARLYREPEEGPR